MLANLLDAFIVTLVVVGFCLSATALIMAGYLLDRVLPYIDNFEFEDIKKKYPKYTTIQDAYKHKKLKELPDDIYRLLKDYTSLTLYSTFEPSYCEESSSKFSVVACPNDYVDDICKRYERTYQFEREIKK